MRQPRQMNEVEKAQHANFTSIINNALSTPEEIKIARHKLEALEWKGQTGPIMELVTKLTDRLDNVEKLGQSMSDEDRESLADLRRLAKPFAKEKLDKLETNVDKALNDLADLILTETQHHSDNQDGWSKHETTLVSMRKERQAEVNKFEVFQQRANDKFREVEAKIDALRSDLNMLVADAVAEVKNTIMAEAG